MRGSKGGGGTGGPDPNPENHKIIGFPSNIGPDPLKIAKLCWAIIGTPAKRHLKNNVVIVGPLLAKLSGCHFSQSSR